MNLKDEKAFIAYFQNKMYHGYSKPFKSINLLEARVIRLNSSFEFTIENIEKIRAINEKLKTVEVDLLAKAKQWKKLAIENKMGKINLSIEIMTLIVSKYENITSTPPIVTLYGEKYRWWGFDEDLYLKSVKQQNLIFDFEFCYSLDILINHTKYFTWEDLISIDSISGSIELFQSDDYKL